MLDDWQRYVVAGEMMILILLSCGMIGLYHDQAVAMPRPVKAVGAAMLWVLAGGTVAVLANALRHEAQTSGTTFLVSFLAPPVIAVGVAVIVSLRRPPPDPRRLAVIRNANLIASQVEHLGHLDPCPNPDCVAARAYFARLVGVKP